LDRSYYWSVARNGEEIGHSFEDLDYAKAAAQADHATRILAAITTPADSKAALDRMIADAEERGMRKAAGIVRERIVFYAAKRDTTKIEIDTYMTLIHTIEALECADDLILAPFMKGGDK
jgi:hypothetical protein